MEPYYYIIFPDELRDNASNVKSYLDDIVPDGIEAVWNNDTTWQTDLQR